MDIFDVQQGSDEWFDCRKGVVTASVMHEVMASGRNGGQSLTRRKLMMRLASEIITGEPCKEWDGNADTQRGQEQEPIARNLYQLRTDAEVQEVGFIREGRAGCSPDGLVGTHGGIEIKCKRPYVHLEALVSGEVPPEHLKQVQASLWVTGRAWWDFVSYSPGLPLFVKRVERDEELIAEIAAATTLFTEQLDALVQQVQGLY